MDSHNHSTKNDHVLMSSANSPVHHGMRSVIEDVAGMPNHDMPGMMKMYFHAGFSETILFKGWKTDSSGTMVASFIGIFILAILYEGLKYFRESLYRKYYTDVNFSSVAVTPGSAYSGGEMHKVLRSKVFSLPHLLQTFLHVVQVIISYFLMLIFMTYNVWLCLAVALGSGVGYFIFGWKKAIIANVSEHCH